MDKKYQKILAYSVDEKITIKQLKDKDDFSEIFDDENNKSKIETLDKWINDNGVIGILRDDINYPNKFQSIKNPPYIIYAMGNLELLDKKILGVVGPRDMSQYGEQVLEGLFQNIQKSEIVTVSGMARGVDYKSHQLSIQSGLPTIAVLGGGLRYYWNSSARGFMQQIIENGGLILSEFRLDFKPTIWSFPQRNRLISGLCDVLFLPEAREGSGSLITAEFAYQQKKEIFVAPNSIFSENGKGVNGLVNGNRATLLSDFSQILDVFDISLGQNLEYIVEKKLKYDLTDEEKKLLKIISQNHDKDFSLWMFQISEDFGEALSVMTDMEMKGYIIQNVPGYYNVNINLNVL